tara:strand:+ start:579 stop:1244 length:666 start_codon:yes stop_codon:yes gene_type:complete
MGKTFMVAGSQVHHMHAITTQTAVIEPVSDAIYPLGDVQVASVEKAFTRLTAGHHDSIGTAFKGMHQLQRVDTAGAGDLDNAGLDLRGGLAVLRFTDLMCCFPTLWAGKDHDRCHVLCNIRVGYRDTFARRRSRIQRMNSADHSVMGIDIHLDGACRAGRRAEATAGTQVLINHGSTPDSADTGQLIIDARGAEGAKAHTVKTGHTDRRLDYCDRAFDGLD